MADTTPKLALKKLAERQDDAEVLVNEDLNSLDALVQASVLDRDLTAPPGGESNGDAYIVAATATGAWVGKEDDVAVYHDGWVFLTPKEGWRVWVEDEKAELFFDGTAWTARPNRRPVKDGITANAGGGQGSAVLLTREVNRVTTVATNGDSVKLPPAVAGLEVVVINDDLAQDLDVFPSSGDQIDSLAADAALTMSAGAITVFYAITATLWRSKS